MSQYTIPQRLAYKQYPIILARLRRQNLIIEAILELVGYRAMWDEQRVTLKRLLKREGQGRYTP